MILYVITPDAIDGAFSFMLNSSGVNLSPKNQKMLLVGMPTIKTVTGSFRKDENVKKNSPSSTGESKYDE